MAQSSWLNCALRGDEAVYSQRAGRHFSTNLMSRYIGVSQNGRFDVSIQELVSKAENPGGFLRKNVF